VQRDVWTFQNQQQLGFVVINSLQRGV
jgi:hypothetical protein